jgi:6-methylsalicylate decarboxylase
VSGDPVPQQIGRLWFDMAGTPFPRQVPALAAAFGTEHLLYGSDYCWTPAPATQAQLASIDAAPPPEGDSWRALTTRNAQRLFPRLAGRDDEASAADRADSSTPRPGRPAR